jgi:hypothetical protein
VHSPGGVGIGDSTERSVDLWQRIPTPVFLDQRLRGSRRTALRDDVEQDRQEIGRAADARIALQCERVLRHRVTTPQTIQVEAGEQEMTARIVWVRLIELLQVANGPLAAFASARGLHEQPIQLRWNGILPRISSAGFGARAGGGVAGAERR